MSNNRIAGPFKDDLLQDQSYVGKIGGMPLYKHDGGREEAGFEGKGGDCVVRALTILFDYSYDELWGILKQSEREHHRKETEEYNKKVDDINERYNVKVMARRRERKEISPDKGISVIAFKKAILDPQGYAYYKFSESDYWDRTIITEINAGYKIDENAGPAKRKRGRSVDQYFLPKGPILILTKRHVVPCIDHHLFDTGTQLLGRSGRRTKLMLGFFFKNDTEIEKPKPEPRVEPVQHESSTINVNNVNNSNRSNNNMSKTPDKRAKLTAEDVTEIRRAAKAGATLSSLAKQFGVSPQCIRNIVQRNTWKHLPDPDVEAADKMEAISDSNNDDDEFDDMEETEETIEELPEELDHPTITLVK